MVVSGFSAQRARSLGRFHAPAPSRKSSVFCTIKIVQQLSRIVKEDQEKSRFKKDEKDSEKR
jgi:hypothetical protein